MDKLFLCSFIVGLLMMSASFSIEQEFIKQPKEKQFYPSCQQYIELNADMVTIANKLLALCVDIQKLAIAEINGYVEGNKECFVNHATKKQRAQAYSKKIKERNELQDIVDKLLLMVE